MNEAESYATMPLSGCLYREHRHWIRRHGWLKAYEDKLNDVMYFVRIDGIFAGQSVMAVFERRPGGGLIFDGYTT